jgi:SIR2-like protein
MFNMSSTLIEDLQREVSLKRVLVVVGAGVSVGATAGTPSQQLASWRGLLGHGIERSITVVPDLPSDWATRLHADLNSTDLDDLLSVAERVSAKLGAPSGGEYRRWLRDAFEGFVATDSSVLEALRDLALPLATTNYDDLLEQASNRKPITWRDPDFERVIRGDEDSILHLHGYWKDSESVVLGISSYERLLTNNRAQSFLRALRSNSTLLFVGFGEGLEDPNFSAFLKWSREVFSESEYRHFRLCREQDLNLVQKRHPPNERIFAISYGNDYGDLSPFLRRLMPGSEGEYLLLPGSPSIGNTGRDIIIEALEKYRRAIRRWFSRWNIGPVATSAGGLGQTLTAELDTMYIPLRLSMESERAQRLEGAQLLPEALLQRERPSVIRGPGGTGKTTWMRWTFRRLLEVNSTLSDWRRVSCL